MPKFYSASIQANFWPAKAVRPLISKHNSFRIKHFNERTRKVIGVRVCLETRSGESVGVFFETWSAEKRANGHQSRVSKQTLRSVPPAEHWLFRVGRTVHPPRR